MFLVDWYKCIIDWYKMPLIDIKCLVDWYTAPLIDIKWYTAPVKNNF